MSPLKINSKRPKNLYIEVVEAIKKAIFNQEFMPGESLPNETRIAEQMNVSRPVVREALRVLQIQGFLKVKRGNKGGTYVTDLSDISIVDHLEDLILTGRLSVKDIIEARLLIEPELFRVAALKAEKEQIEELEIIMKTMTCENDGEVRSRLNLKFHWTVVKIARNPIYTRTMKIIIDFLENFMRGFKPSNLYIHKDSEHLDILAAIKNKQADRAATLARDHIRTASEKMVALEQSWLKKMKSH